MEDYDYYVFRATSTATRLERAETDEWGQTFPVGSLVIKGNYFCLKKDEGGGCLPQEQGLYTYEGNTKAIVWASTVVFHGFTMTRQEEKDASGHIVYAMDCDTHEAAMDALDLC